MVCAQIATTAKQDSEALVKNRINRIVGSLPKIPETHEFDMIRTRLGWRQPKNDFTLRLEMRAEALKEVDRVFFVAYFSKLYDRAVDRTHFSETIAWNQLLDNAESEAMNGRRIRLPEELTTQSISLMERGKICEHTSPRFEIAFRFRNVVRVDADLPDEKCFVSLPASEDSFGENGLGRFLDIGSNALQMLKWAFANFTDQRRRDPDYYRELPEDDWKTVRDASGRNYAIKMTEESVEVYRCSNALVYAKGGSLGFPFIHVDTGEFSLYSPERNAFYRASMESGKVTDTCHVKRKPSSELKLLFDRISQAEN